MTSYGAGLVVENHRGNDYGSMPMDALLHKLEETDPSLVDEVRDRDEFRNDDYDDYARGEIIDWSPDSPVFESDHARRDPALSRTRLNLRYNGTRGTAPDVRHPDLFIGFTGNDPRGVDNTPRFDLLRDQNTSRLGLLTVRMGDNDDNAVVERPWTAQAFSKGMQERLKRAKRDMKVFTEQKVGSIPGRAFIANPGCARELRALELQNNETLQTAGARFSTGDHAPANGIANSGVRGVDSGRAGSEKAPWRFVGTDTPLGVQKYGSQSGGGRATIGAGAQASRFAPSDQSFATSAKTLSANRRVLGATLAAAARYNVAARSGDVDQRTGPSYEASATGTHLMPASDVAQCTATLSRTSRGAASSQT